MPKNHRLKIESRRIFAALVAVLFLVGCQTTQPAPITPATIPPNEQASDPPLCNNRSVVVDHLEAKYAERQKFRGLAVNGLLFEVLTAKSGSWTMLVTTPVGMACPIAAGDAWQEIKHKQTDTPS